MKKPLIKKILASFIAVIFTVTTLSQSVSATGIIGVPPLPASFAAENTLRLQSVLPLTLGKITNLHVKQSPQVIINIQDLHSHAQTQRNINQIINLIVSNYKVSAIYAEGGVGDISVDWIKQIQDEELRSRVIEQLLEDGILTAAEYYAMTSRGNYELRMTNYESTAKMKGNYESTATAAYIPLKGIEDREIHQINLKRLAAIQDNKKRYESSIAKIEKEIKVLNKLYTNRRNVKFNKILSDYENKEIADAKFYRVIAKYVEAINKNPERYNNFTKISLENYPNVNAYTEILYNSREIDNKAASMELQRVVNDLKSSLSYVDYKYILDETINFQDTDKTIEILSLVIGQDPSALRKLPNLERLIKLNKLAKELNPIDLITEQRNLTERIKFALAYDDTEAEISFITDFFKYFKDYMSANLTQDDWIYVKDNLPQFIEIFNKYAAGNYLAEISDDFAEITAYYDLNTKRNEIFLQQLGVSSSSSLSVSVISEDSNRGSALKNQNGFPIEALGNDTTMTALELLKQAQDVKILITGGYHSEGLKNLLSDKNISLIQITPNVTADITEAQKAYENIIKEQSKLPKNALSYILLSSSIPPYQKAVIIKTLVAINLDEAAIAKAIEADKASISEDKTKIVIDGQEFEITAAQINVIDADKKGKLQEIVDAFAGTFSKQTFFDFVSLFGKDEPGPITEIEREALQNKEKLAGISNWQRYPRFLQMFLLEIETGLKVKARGKIKSVFDVSSEEVKALIRGHEKDIKTYIKAPTFGLQIPKFSAMEDAQKWMSDIDKKFNGRLISAIGSVDGMKWFSVLRSNKELADEYALISEANAALEQAIKDNDESAAKSARETLKGFENFRFKVLSAEIMAKSGGYIAVQTADKVDKDGKKIEVLDCYIIGLDGLEKYKVNDKVPHISRDEVNKRNTDAQGKSLESRLAGLFGTGTTLPQIEGLTGLHKQVSEKMIRADILGLNIHTINSNGLSQEAKNSAFLALTYDKTGELKSYHVVNSQGTSIMPIMYEFAGEATTDVLAVANNRWDENGEQVPVSFMSSGLTSNILWRLIKEYKPQAFNYKKKSLFGYKISAAITTLQEAKEFASTLPGGFLEKIGSVDNAVYFDILSAYMELNEDAINAIKSFASEYKVKINGKEKDVIEAIKAARSDKGAIESKVKEKKPKEANFKNKEEYAKAMSKFDKWKSGEYDKFAKKYGELINFGILYQFKQDAGSVIALQTSSDGILDVYIIGKGTYNKKYDKNIDWNVINKKTKIAGKTLQDRLLGMGIDIASLGTDVIEGIDKQQPETMIRAQDIGLNITVESSAGAQETLSGAFIAISEDGSWHIVNAEASELVPIQYELAEQIKPTAREALLGYDAKTIYKIIGELNGSLLSDYNIAGKIADVAKGIVTVRVGADGTISMIYQYNGALEKLLIPLIGNEVYYEKNGTSAMISFDNVNVPKYFKNLLDFVMKSGLYSLWKKSKGELKLSDKDEKYFRDIERKAEETYRAKQAKIEELEGYVLRLKQYSNSSFNDNQRKQYDEAAIAWSNAKKVLSEYYKDKSNPAFQELIEVANFSENDISSVKKLEKHIKRLKAVQQGAALVSDSTIEYYTKTLEGLLELWQVKQDKANKEIIGEIIKKTMEEVGFQDLSEEKKEEAINYRIISQLLAPEKEAGIIAQIVEAVLVGKITLEQILSGTFPADSIVGKFLSGDHSKYPDAKELYHQGLYDIVSKTIDALSYSMPFTLPWFVIPFCQPVAVQIAALWFKIPFFRQKALETAARESIAPHMQWNEEHPDPLTTDGGKNSGNIKGFEWYILSHKLDDLLYGGDIFQEDINIFKGIVWLVSGKDYDAAESVYTSDLSKQVKSFINEDVTWDKFAERLKTKANNRKEADYSQAIKWLLSAVSQASETPNKKYEEDYESSQVKIPEHLKPFMEKLELLLKPKSEREYDYYKDSLRLIAAILFKNADYVIGKGGKRYPLLLNRNEFMKALSGLNITQESINKYAAESAKMEYEYSNGRVEISNDEWRVKGYTKSGDLLKGMWDMSTPDAEGKSIETKVKTIADLRNAVTNDEKTSIAFVCSYNELRSASAEVLLKYLLYKNGKEKVEVFSAGLNKMFGRELSGQVRKKLDNKYERDNEEDKKMLNAISDDFVSEFIVAILLNKIPDFIITFEEFQKKELLEIGKILGVELNVFLFSELDPGSFPRENKDIDGSNWHFVINNMEKIFESNFKKVKAQGTALTSDGKKGKKLYSFAPFALIPFLEAHWLPVLLAAGGVAAAGWLVWKVWTNYKASQIQKNEKAEKDYIPDGVIKGEAELDRLLKDIYGDSPSESVIKIDEAQQAYINATIEDCDEEGYKYVIFNYSKIADRQEELMSYIRQFENILYLHNVDGRDPDSETILMVPTEEAEAVKNKINELSQPKTDVNKNARIEDCDEEGYKYVIFNYSEIADRQEELMSYIRQFENILYLHNVDGRDPDSETILMVPTEEAEAVKNKINELSAIMDKNREEVNRRIRAGEAVWKIAAWIAFSRKEGKLEGSRGEQMDSFKPRSFFEAHRDKRGVLALYGGTLLIAAITGFMFVGAGIAAAITIGIAGGLLSHKPLHFIIDYVYIKNSDLYKARQVLQKQEDQITVLVVNDAIAGKATGIKVEGTNIRYENVNGQIVIYANGIEYDTAVKEIHGSKALKKIIKEHTGADLTNVSLEGIAADKDIQAGDIVVDGDIIKVNAQEYESAYSQGFEALSYYLHHAREIARNLKETKTDKAIADFTNKSVNDVVKALQNVKTYSSMKLAVSAKDAKDIAQKVNLSALRLLGVEVFVAGNETAENYQSLGFCGEINGSLLMDYYTGQTIKVNTADDAGGLDAIGFQNLLNQAEGFVLIDIDVINNNFKSRRNILQLNDNFAALTGSLKVKFGLTEINLNEAISMAYRLDLNNMPILETEENLNVEHAQGLLDSLPSNHSVKTLLNTVKKFDTDGQVNNIIIERILIANFLAKKGLKTSGKKTVIDDKQMEVLLGKALFQLDGTDISPNIEFGDIQHYNDYIIQESKKNTKQAAANVVEMIFLYHGIAIDINKYKEQLYNSNRQTGYKAILAAA
ncbi:MAG: hypothetical protein FWG57_07815 [Endomicrobia bacterium]|nr:hypothetical protein [Endomicrobiia bacterium]